MARRYKPALDSAMFAVTLAATIVCGDGPVARAGDVDRKPLGDARRGETLYQASCVVCHGTGATGGIGPKLAGNPVLANDEAFWKIVFEGRHVMPPLKGAVSEQQMADIRAWLQTLR